MVVKFLTKLSLDALKKKSTVYEIFRFFRFLIKKILLFLVFFLYINIGLFVFFPNPSYVDYERNKRASVDAVFCKNI
jgi:hypothetical protein